MGHLDSQSPSVRKRNPSSSKQHHSVNHADSLSRTVDREQLHAQTGNMLMMRMGVDGTGMSQAKGAPECEEVFSNFLSGPGVDSSSRNDQSYVVTPLLALENAVEPHTLTEPCANDSLLSLIDGDGAKSQFADTFDGSSKWDQINKNITDTQSGHNEPRIQNITSSEKQLQQNDIDSSNTKIQLISNASVANSKDNKCYELGVNENKISLSVSHHLSVYESVSVEKPFEQEFEESTKHSQSQPSVEHSQSKPSVENSQTQSSVEHSKSQPSTEHNQSQDSVECSQPWSSAEQSQSQASTENRPSHNFVEHSKLQDSLEHIKSLDSVECCQSQNLVEHRNIVEHSQSQDSVEYSQPQNLVEHSQSRDSIEHSQTQGSVECSQSQDAIEHSQSLDSVECSQSQNLVEHSQSRDSIEHSQTQGSVECRQSQNSVEDRQLQDSVEHIQSKDSVECSQLQDSIECSQSWYSVEHRQSQDSIEHGESQSSEDMPSKNVIKHSQSQTPVEHTKSQDSVKCSQSQTSVEHNQSQDSVEHSQSQSSVEDILSLNVINHNKSQDPVENSLSLTSLQHTQPNDSVECSQSQHSVQNSQSHTTSEHIQLHNSIECSQSQNSIQHRKSRDLAEQNQSKNTIEHSQSQTPVEHSQSQTSVEHSQSQTSVEHSQSQVDFIKASSMNTLCTVTKSDSGFISNTAALDEKGQLKQDCVDVCMHFEVSQSLKTSGRPPVVSECEYFAAERGFSNVPNATSAGVSDSQNQLVINDRTSEQSDLQASPLYDQQNVPVLQMHTEKKDYSVSSYHMDSHCLEDIRQTYSEDPELEADFYETHQCPISKINCNTQGEFTKAQVYVTPKTFDTNNGDVLEGTHKNSKAHRIIKGYQKECTIVPSIEQSVIYSDSSGYIEYTRPKSLSVACPNTKTAEADRCPVDSPVESLASLFEISYDKSQVSPTDVCFELSDGLHMNCKQVAHCVIEYTETSKQFHRPDTLSDKQARQNESLETIEPDVDILSSACTDPFTNAQSPFEYPLLNSRNNEYNSDSNNNIKAITLEECALGEQMSLPNYLQNYSRFTNNDGSVISKDGDCKDSAPANQATHFKAPEMRTTIDSRDNFAKPSEFNKFSSHRDAILKQLCDFCGGKECQLHSSAVEGEQTAGGFHFKGTDGISHRRTAVLQTLIPSHTDDQCSIHGEVNADSKNCEFSHIGHLLAHKHPELVQEKSILPLSGSLKVDDTYALENMERKLENVMAISPESTDSTCETSDPLCKQSLQLRNSETEGAFVTCCRILPITNLEAILELDHSPESSFVMKNRLGEQQEGSEECSSCNGVTNQPHEDISAMCTKANVATVMNEPDAGETMSSLSNGFDSSDGCSISSFVSQDLDSSTNSEETEDSTQSSSSLRGSARNKRTQSGKSSVFSVFSRMPSFRKIKREYKGNSKVDPEIKDSGEDGDERGELMYNSLPTRNKSNPSLYKTSISQSTDHLTDFTKFVDHSNDDIFEKAFTINTQNKEKYTISQNLYQQHKDGEALHFRVSSKTEGFQQKRSKSTDNLNLRLKLAMAHKSLSSLFESRYPERDNQEQIAQSENEEVKNKQSWRKSKRSKEAELCKRTLSVPGMVCDKSIHQSHIDCAFCAPQNRSRLDSSPASQKSLRNMCHSDLQSLKSGLQEESEDSKYLEGGELPCAPHLDSDQISEEDFESNVEDRTQSPVYPTVFALANQMSPTWTRSISFETTDTPTRPMSPKPHSAGLGWTNRRSFCYPSRSVASSLCLLGQGVSTDGLSDPPQRPTSLKPRTAQLTTTHSFDSEFLLEDSSSDSQSQNSLNSASLINKQEVSQL